MTDTQHKRPDEIGAPGLMKVRDFLEEPTQTPVNPLKIIGRLYRGIWIRTLLAAVAFGALLGFLVFGTVKPAYESQGLIRIAAKQPKIMYADNDDSRLRLYDAFVASEATYIQSRPVLDRAHTELVEKLQRRNGTAPLTSPKDFADALSITRKKGLITVSARNADPMMAQAFVHALLGSYLALHTEQNGSRQSLRARELEVRVMELQAKQQRLSNDLLEIGEEYDATSLAKAHLTKVTQLEELDLRIGELTNTLMEMEATDGALDADTGDMEIKRATLLDRAMADMVFERAKRAAELEKLQLRYQPSHPKVATLAASLAVIDNAIESRRRLIATLGKTGAITRTDGSAKSQSLAELEALNRKLSTRQAKLSNEAKSLNGKLIQLRRINDEKAQIAGMLGETRRILDQVLLESRNSLPGTIEILSRGGLPDMPTEDKRKQFAALAFMFGAGFICMLVLAVRQFSGVTRYSDDVAGLFPTQQEIHVFGAKPEPGAIASLLADMQMNDRWNQAGATIVSALRFHPLTRYPGQQLCEVATKQGLRTLLVLACEDGARSDSGFSEMIKGTADIQPLRHGSYDLLAFGQADILNGYAPENARQVLAKLSPKYDLIILDSGLPENDFSARILPSLSHMNLLAIDPGTRIRPIRRALSRLSGCLPIFTSARPDDPGLAREYQNPPQTKGANHAQAA